VRGSDRRRRRILKAPVSEEAEASPSRLETHEHNNNSGGQPDHNPLRKPSEYTVEEVKGVISDD